MSSAKEKAKELVDKFKPHSHFWVHDLGRQKDYEIEQLENAKKCALIAVDEAIEFELRIVKEVEWLSIKAEMGFKCERLFWQEVKREIEKL